MKPFIRLALLAALLGSAGAANASLQCTVPASVTLNFGVYNDSSPTTTDVSTSFSVSCCHTGGTGSSGTITITFGTSFNSGQINTRQLKNGANTDLMNYQLYFNSFGGTVWGDGVNGGTAFTQSVSGITSCSTYTSVGVTSPIFGRIFPQQAVSAGHYTDTVTISITP